MKIPPMKQGRPSRQRLSGSFVPLLLAEKAPGGNPSGAFLGFFHNSSAGLFSSGIYKSKEHPVHDGNGLAGARHRIYRLGGIRRLPSRMDGRTCGFGRSRCVSGAGSRFGRGVRRGRSALRRLGRGDGGSDGILRGCGRSRYGARKAGCRQEQQQACFIMSDLGIPSEIEQRTCQFTRRARFRRRMPPG